MLKDVTLNINNKTAKQLSDLATDDNNNLILTKKNNNVDITWRLGENAKFYALRNYLMQNKPFLLQLTPRGVQQLVLAKALSLGISADNVRYNTISAGGKLKIILNLNTDED